MGSMGKLWFRYLGFVCFLGICINLLYLAVPIYIMVVYDKVLYSFSASSLTTLTLGLLLACIVMGILEYLRSGIRIKAGIFLEKELLLPVLQSLHKDAADDGPALYERGLEDLACLKESVWGGTVLQIIELPWMLVYFALLFFCHPWIMMLVLGVFFMSEFFYFLARVFSKNRTVSGDSISAANLAFVKETLDNAELVSGMGLLPGLAGHYREKQNRVLAMAASAEVFRSGINAVVICINTLAVAGVFGLGAFLYFDDQITTGVMLAAVFITARVLYPFGPKFAGMKQGIMAAAAYRRIKTHVDTREKKAQLDLPRPSGRLSVEGLMKIRNNRHLLQNINFALEPGEFLGIIGPTGAGKTILLKLILGIWEPTSGKVRLDGADTAFWDKDAMGPHVGYVPQITGLLSGRVSDNIARFSQADADQVVLAAQKAGAHDMILGLTGGYDTLVGKAGENLSQGQCRRIAIAAALYQNPALVVMDRPNSDMDEAGLTGLLETMQVLKQEKTTLVMVTENPKLLVNSDKILFLKDGQTIMFGPAKEVLTNLRSKQVSQQG
jgi:ATP-binding cassette, subfamily C, bacterial EexD